MLLADWIFLGGLMVLIALGAIIGFGRLLKFITGGIVGILISVLLCYLFGGLVLDIPFVHQMLSDLASKWAHIEFLTKIHLEIIIYYIAFFLITMLVRIILVKILQNVMESENIALRVTNKVLGAVLFAVLGILIMLLVFQIIAWIGGNTAQSFASSLAGSAIVKPIYENNPLATLISLVKV